jgi:murein DD-endopeptidase MepM/ murein hydrolase activator NlpD
MRVLTLTRPRMRGDDVRAVQRALRIGADGIFGPKTAEAIFAWKRRVGYPEAEINAGLGERGQGYLLGTLPFPLDYLIRATGRALSGYVSHMIGSTPPFGVGTAPARPLRWPIKPFEGPHQVRGTFGEVRGLQGVAGTKGLEGDALHQFLATLNPVLAVGRRIIHHGIDIVAPDLTPVYAVTDGVAKWGGSNNYSRFVRVGDFEYVHLKDPVRQGTRVKAFTTVIGTVYPGQEHVHFTRWTPDGPVNPLLFGGMANYVDTAPPVIRDLVAYRENGTKVRLDKINGAVALFVNATDVQSNGGNETGVYRLGYRIKNATGAAVVGPYKCVQMDCVVPEPVGNLLYTTQSTRHKFEPIFWTRLTIKSPSADGTLHTGHLPPGNYTVEVTASDVAGNTTVRDVPITIIPV